MVRRHTHRDHRKLSFITQNEKRPLLAGIGPGFQNLHITAHIQQDHGCSQLQKLRNPPQKAGRWKVNINFLTAEPVCRLLDQIHIIHIRTVQKHGLCPGIQIFLHILQSPHPAAGDNRNIDQPRQLLENANGTLMVLIALRQIPQQQFIRPVIIIIMRQRFQRTAADT